jgi:signal transduction histidine kinase/CheY-like chemotaxis protein/predicted hydrocarbon binding protein
MKPRDNDELVKPQDDARLEADSSENALNTVSVPEPFRAIFTKAQEYVQEYFAHRIEDPKQSSILISGERYILVRAASMSVEFFDLVTSLYQDKGGDEARSVANNLLFDIAKAIGKADAKSFHAKMGVTNPIERLSAGPIHFSFSGWAFVKISPESSLSPDSNFFLIYEHPFSFESDAWIKQGRRTDAPVCIMNAGYSSGWCEESFGISLVAAEVECQARGDAQCRFIMAPPERIEEHLEKYRKEKMDQSGAPDVQRTPDAEITVPEFFQRKRMEEELRRSRDELENRVAERTTEVVHAYNKLKQQSNERLRMEDELRQSQKMEAVGRLAGGIAHDFNNLLSIIMGYAEFLEQGPGDAEAVQRQAGKITAAAKKAAGLTSQLLAFSRRQVLAPQVTELNTVISEICEMVPRLIGEDVELELRLAPELFRVRVDRVQMEQVILNLAVNGRDAMPNGGKITIETKNVNSRNETGTAHLGIPPGEYVLLTVCDTGNGIPAEVLPHIFEPFFTTKVREKGTGLGLATVYGIVKQSDGFISAESEQGQGSRFLIWLPRSTEALAEAESDARLTPELRGNETILVVEDEEELREAVGDYLAGLGYTVLRATNGMDALDRVSQHHGNLDLMVTDVVMPKMNGPELAGHLLESHPKVKVIYVSGYTDNKIAQRGVLEAGTHFLQKPFPLHVLAGKIREVMANPGQ